MSDISETIPDDLLAIESQLRTLRPEAPRLLILQPHPSPRAGGIRPPVIALLIGILIGGLSVDTLRPVPQVETADGRRQTAAEMLPLPEPEPIVVNNVPSPVGGGLGWGESVETQTALTLTLSQRERGQRNDSLSQRERGQRNSSLSRNGEKIDLDVILEEYTRRAKLFAHVERVAAMPSPSNGSISDPTSVFRLRETMNL